MTSTTPPTPSPMPRVKPSACRPGTLAGDLRVALGRSSRRIRQERGEADLPDGLFAILVHLMKDGPTTPGVIAERERVRPPSVTRGVQTLEELGFVERAEHPTDGRLVVISVTERGVDEVRETRRRRDAWLTQRIAGFTAEERTVLAQAAGLLQRIAEA